VKPPAASAFSVHTPPLPRFSSCLTGKALRIFLILGLAGFCSPPFAAAQGADPGALDWDFDTLFDGPSPEGPQGASPGEPGGSPGDSPSGGPGSGRADAATGGGDGSSPAGSGAAAGGGSADAGAEDGGSLLADLLGRSGFSLDFSYNANAGFSPGWSETPWFAGTFEPVYSHVLGIGLTSYVNMDVRISDTFRTHSSLLFAVPGSSALSLSEFFIDYQIRSRVYFRVGKFSHNWGISPNFSAANLLSRVPQGKGGDPYIMKINIPIGIGGLELLALTRTGFMQGATPAFSEIGYGAKYNLAFTWADIDLGAFYYAEMPLRASASVKTTLADTELYVEAVGAVRHEVWDGFTGSANMGFARSFFDGLVSMNGELFWNGEEDVYYFSPKTELTEAQTPPFIPGLNAAWNLVFRPGWVWNLRFAMTGRWALETNTAYILPGLSFAPLPHLDVSLGFPIALGGRGGRYYSKDHAAAANLPFAGNADTANGRGRPFALALLITLKGGYHIDR
jgi:hypothetical protein